MSYNVIPMQFPPTFRNDDDFCVTLSITAPNPNPT